MMKKKWIVSVLMITMLGSMSGCSAVQQISGAVNEELSAGTEATTESTTEAGTEQAAVEIAEEDKLKNLVMTDYLTLPDYTNMEVSVAEIPVMDEDVMEYINSYILTSYEVTDRAVKEGDVARIDYVGKKDGEAFNGGSANGYELEIGSGTFIPGFEEGLVGVKPGETVDLDITFPEQYQNTELAGQPVVFTVTVQAIMEPATYDTVTPEQMKAMGLTYTTKEELWDAAKKECEEQAEQVYQNNVSGTIYNQIQEGVEFKTIPDYLIADFSNYYSNYMNSMIQAQLGVDIATYLSYTGMTQEQYDSQIAEMSEESVKRDMIFEAIADAEGIDIDDDELQKLATATATEYQYESVDTFLSTVGQDRYRQEELMDKVLENLKSKVKVTKTAPVEKTTEEATEAETETEAAAQ